ncbi:MAG: ANTAR domain-containing protein [Janthinobacterium lividum]
MRADSLTPSVLSQAVVDLLPIDAASISSMLEVLRLPLGASSRAAQTAEELQTSIGEGPCLAAAVTRTVRVADEAELTTRWPTYGEELLKRTPFRSVASMPLKTPDGEVFAAMDLYAEDGYLSQRLDLDAIDEFVVGPVSALLSICMAGVHDVDLDQAMPDWYREATARRHHVWVATGMLIGRRRQPTADALAVLRASAYSRDLTLDELADGLVDGRLTLDDLER